MLNVKPARPDLIILDPHTGTALPPEGRDVFWSGYWDRRLADGDIEVIDQPARKQPAKKEI